MHSLKKVEDILRKVTESLDIDIALGKMEDVEYINSLTMDAISQLISTIPDLYRRGTYDSLTELKTGIKEFKDEFTKQKDLSSSFVIAMDLNSFKEINDQYGHEIGNGVLRYFATLLKRSFRVDDQIYRVGGDEFLIGVHNVDEENIKKFINRVNENLKNKFTIRNGYNVDQNINLTTSIGYARYNHDYGLDYCIKVSDALLYEDKATYREKNTVQKRTK